MRNRIIILIVLFGMVFLSVMDSNAQNNLKLLDLTGNVYSSGTSFYVNIGTQMQVTTDYTFEAWLYVDTKPSGASGYFPVIMDRKTVFSWFLIDDPSSTGSTYCLRFVARDASDNIIASVRSDGNNGSTHSPMNLQDWYHIAVSRDGTTLRLYINGTMVDNSTDANFILNTPSGKAVNYGARYWSSSPGYDRFIDGALDECRYSDMARYTGNFIINTTSPPHDTTGDPNTILLFNFDHSNLANTTSANTYAASAHGTMAYADWDGFPLDKLPLPITYLKELRGEVIHENLIELSWATATELHNSGFEIQRSVDVEHWDSIGFVTGMGSSNIPHGYFFTDNSPKPANYYRLRQMDWDGNLSYSHIKCVLLEQNIPVKIYPNPASSLIKIIGIKSNQVQKIELFDVRGKNMENILIHRDNTVDISKIIEGIYFLKISKINGEVITKRFIKTK